MSYTVYMTVTSASIFLFMATLSRLIRNSSTNNLSAFFTAHESHLELTMWSPERYTSEAYLAWWLLQGFTEKQRC